MSDLSRSNGERDKMKLNKRLLQKSISSSLPLRYFPIGVYIFSSCSLKFKEWHRPCGCEITVKVTIIAVKYFVRLT
jgi:hypothetical protein